MDICKEKIVWLSGLGRRSGSFVNYIKCFSSNKNDTSFNTSPLVQYVSISLSLFETHRRHDLLPTPSSTARHLKTILHY
jgi:hypothetical protein